LDLWSLLPLAGLLVASGLFSGAETALFSVARDRLSALKQAGTAGAMVARLREEPRQLLITLLFGNLVVNILYFAGSTLWVSEVATQSGAAAAGVAGAAVFGVFLVGGEILPKTIAVRAPEPVSRLVAFPIGLMAALSGRIRRPLDRLVGGLTSLIAGPDKPSALSPDELAALAGMAEQTGSLDAREGEMLREVFEAADVRVRELMTPRVDLAAAEVRATWDEVLAIVRESGETTIPLYRDSPDLIVGIVEARQALFHPDTPPREVMERPVFVPETMTLDQLLREFRARGAHTAVVVDEYGVTEGLVQLTDAVNEIVDDAVREEHGPEAPQPQTLGLGRVLLPGSLPVRDYRALLGPRGPNAPVASLGGYVTWLFGRVPAIGDHFSHGGITFTVQGMRGNRVAWVLVELEGVAPGLPAEDVA
jgi:CBS domain containing-hemolysin-like protein